MVRTQWGRSGMSKGFLGTAPAVRALFPSGRFGAHPARRLREEHEEGGVHVHQQHLNEQRAHRLQERRGGGSHPVGLRVAENVQEVGVHDILAGVRVDAGDFGAGGQPRTENARSRERGRRLDFPPTHWVRTEGDCARQCKERWQPQGGQPRHPLARSDGGEDAQEGWAVRRLDTDHTPHPFLGHRHLEHRDDGRAPPPCAKPARCAHWRVAHNGREHEL